MLTPWSDNATPYSFVSISLSLIKSTENSPVKPEKIRRYDQVDLSKEFQIRKQRREEEKHKRLTQLYEKHDERLTQLKKSLPQDVSARADSKADGDKSDTDALTDGEQLYKRQSAMKVYEAASQELIKEMIEERAELVEHFDKDTDLKSKMVI